MLGLIFYFLGNPINTTSCNGSLPSGNRSLRNDLLVAADSVTNAMSSLVKELNSGPKNRLSYTFLVDNVVNY